MTHIDPSISSFVEKFGLFLERWGMSPSAARIMGLLLLAERPQSLDEMAEALDISKASASVGARACAQIGLIEQVSLRGNRKMYYQFKRHAWLSLMERGSRAYGSIADLADEGVSIAGDNNPQAQERLAEMARLYRHLAKRMPELVRELE